MNVMALLERRERVEIKRIPVSLPADVLEMLDRYAKYLNRDKSEVLAAAVRHAVQLDEEFCRAEGITPAGVRPRGRRSADGSEAQTQSAV
jgi:hypothetical protein